ncbi:MAG TPA: hypothetical protein PKD73_10555 [Burkholderiaceae bacterium]|nr:hypothetical protein [Burkholderiaceae bacterium]
MPMKPTDIRAALIASMFFLTGGLPVIAHSACYTIFDGKGTLVHQASSPQVDMSQQLHETVPKMFGPGAMMEFSVLDGDCRPIGDQGLLVPYAQAQPVSVQAPAAVAKPAATKQTRRSGKPQKRQPQGAAAN